MVRLFGRHLKDRVLLVVLVSESDGFTLIRYTTNRSFRKDLERSVQAGSQGVGIVALQSETDPRVERCFHFPWHSESSLDDTLCRRIEEALASMPIDLLHTTGGIELPPRAIL